MESTEMKPEEPAAGVSGPTQGVSDPTEGLARRVEELETQLKEKDGKYVYLYAEFENFKKRVMKERSDLLKFGWENAARELLQVIDNLERALEHMPSSTDKTLVQGLHMVINQFRATLQKQGVEPIQSLERDFDPNLHEAVGQEASAEPEGKVVKEHLRGYTLHGRLLRPSRVTISSGNAGSGNGDGKAAS